VNTVHIFTGFLVRYRPVIDPSSPAEEVFIFPEIPLFYTHNPLKGVTDGGCFLRSIYGRNLIFVSFKMFLPVCFRKNKKNSDLTKNKFPKINLNFNQVFFSVFMLYLLNAVIDDPNLT
jgi:hypothetical protein